MFCFKPDETGFMFHCWSVRLPNVRLATPLFSLFSSLRKREEWTDVVRRIDMLIILILSAFMKQFVILYYNQAFWTFLKVEKHLITDYSWAFSQNISTWRRCLVLAAVEPLYNSPLGDRGKWPLWGGRGVTWHLLCCSGCNILFQKVLI